MLEQGRALAVLAAAVARFFSGPSRVKAALVRPLLGRCRVAVRSGRQDAIRASRHLAEGALLAARAVEEASLFGVPKNRVLVGAASALRDAARSLRDAVLAVGRDDAHGCVESVVSVKRHSQRASLTAGAGLTEALELPNVVDGLKTKEIFIRLARSADEMHQAADILGEMVAVNK